MSVVTIPATSSQIRVGDSAPPKLETGANTGVFCPSSAANQIADLAWGGGTGGGQAGGTTGGTGGGTTGGQTDSQGGQGQAK
mgnify:CR=1 FL=1